MVFSSNVFLFLFLPAVLAVYYICPRRVRNIALLAFSLLFYGWGEPRYLSVMVFVILLNFIGGAWISRRKAEGKSAKGALALTVALNLAVLFVFKYTGFFAETVKKLTGAGFAVPAIALPIGISFYIFQSMSYTIDVYRGIVPPQRNVLDFGLYVSLFPQLIAGPIVRYRDVAEQIRGRRENLQQFTSGIGMFVIGLGKKLLLANPMGALWQELSSSAGLPAWIGMAAYTLQIYFDFSGYSDMAIGLGRMFGFDFLPNFDHPYISTSVTEFWRRWHISLSGWFREYVYIPLGGNRRGLKRQLLNLLIVWCLTGLWHGASWNFVLWGLYYAVLLICEKLFLLKFLERLPRLVRHALLLLTVGLGWMLFYFEQTPQLFSFLAGLFRPAEGAHALHTALAYLPVMLAAAVASTPLPARVFAAVKNQKVSRVLKIALAGAVLLLCTASLASQSYNPFIYFRF